MKAWAWAENSAPDVNSWSKPAMGTSCSVMQPVTVPCDTPTVGTSDSRAAWLLAAALRAEPGAVQAQRHLADAIGHMHAVAAPEQAEDGQRARWLVGEGALQHQHRTVIRQPAHLARQAFDRRAVHVEGVVGRVARDDRDFGAAPDGLVHRKAEAAVGLGKVLLAVVQVGKLRDPDHGVTSL